MKTETMEKVELIASEIARGGRNIIFTGAGISTENGDTLKLFRRYIAFNVQNIMS